MLPRQERLLFIKRVRLNAAFAALRLLTVCIATLQPCCQHWLTAPPPGVCPEQQHPGDTQVQLIQHHSLHLNCATAHSTHSRVSAGPPALAVLTL